MITFYILTFVLPCLSIIFDEVYEDEVDDNGTSVDS